MIVCGLSGPGATGSPTLYQLAVTWLRVPDGPAVINRHQCEARPFRNEAAAQLLRAERSAFFGAKETITSRPTASANRTSIRQVGLVDADPSVVQVVPLTATIRDFGSEVRVEPDSSNGLDQSSSAQCQHVRAVSTGRVEHVRGNVGVVVLTQIRSTIGLIFDIPT